MLQEMRGACLLMVSVCFFSGKGQGSTGKDTPGVNRLSCGCGVMGNLTGSWVMSIAIDPRDGGAMGAKLFTSRTGTEISIFIEENWEAVMRSN